MLRGKSATAVPFRRRRRQLHSKALIFSYQLKTNDYRLDFRPALLCRDRVLIDVIAIGENGLPIKNRFAQN